MNKGTPVDPLTADEWAELDAALVSTRQHCLLGKLYGALATKPAPADPLREAFERWLTGTGCNLGLLERGPSGAYLYVNDEWRGWQACAALATKPAETAYWKIIDKDGRIAAMVGTEDGAIAEQAWQDENNARFSPHRIEKPGTVHPTESAGKAVQRPVDDDTLALMARAFYMERGRWSLRQVGDQWNLERHESDGSYSAHLSRDADSLRALRDAASMRCAIAASGFSPEALGSDDKAKTEPERGAVQPPAPEPFARVLYWCGPQYMFGQHEKGRTIARTFDEYPKSAEGQMYWREGELLYRAAPSIAQRGAALTDEQIDAIALRVAYGGDADIPHRAGWCEDIGRPFARAIIAALSPERPE